MTDIEKLVEECGEALCALIYKEGAWATIDAEDRRLYRRDARAVIRRTLEWAAGEATKFLVGDPKNGVPLRNPMPHEIAERLRSLASMENTRADT